MICKLVLMYALKSYGGVRFRSTNSELSY